ncbi:MAG: transporter substrate-binding domain-containing protein [Treponema sp.]|jgi:putative glutamine transport system substrate-binding protein|nr:transporter substrate-binding domain-containing protein [Treponema sp.]
MKIRLLLLTQLFAAGFLLSGCNDDPAYAAQVQAIRKRGIIHVGTQSDAPRISYLNPETNELEGLEIDLARHIAEAVIGDKDAVSFILTTTPLRGPMLDNGEVDMIIAAYTITEERKRHYNFTSPYYVDHIGFMVRKDSGITEFADMQGKTIGVVRGTTASQSVTIEADMLGITVAFAEFSSNPLVLAALLAGQVDAYSIDTSLLIGYLQEETRLLPDRFDPQEYGIATKRENDALVAYLDTLILRMQQDGTLPALLRKWEL